MVIYIFFFFQAEDGIRDIGVTGVQTCALPICTHTLLLTSSTTFAVNPHLRPDLPYRLAQFRPITQVMRARLVLFFDPPPSVPSLTDLVEDVKPQLHGISSTPSLRGWLADRMSAGDGKR